MANEKNLYQRILAVSAEIKNVEKNLSVEVYGGKSYKAVADYDVVVAVKNAEAKHGILSIPVSQELVEHEIMEYTTSKGDRKTQFVDIVKMTLRHGGILELRRGIQAASCVGPGKSTLPFELRRKAGDCSRVTAGPIDLI